MPERAVDRKLVAILSADVAVGESGSGSDEHDNS